MLVFNTDAVIIRMKQLLGAGDLGELADKLGTSERALKEWETQNVIPFADLLSVANHCEVSLDWLIFGKEPQTLLADEEMILTTYRRLPSKYKIEVMRLINRLDNYGEHLGVSQNNLGGMNNYINGGVVINN